eukprot:6767679-Prymnesium_polylepis.1
MRPVRPVRSWFAWASERGAREGRRGYGSARADRSGHRRHVWKVGARVGGEVACGATGGGA